MIEPTSSDPEGWMPISDAPLDGTPCDLWMNGQRWTDFVWSGRGWQREEGYPTVTRRLVSPPSHFIRSPGPPVGAEPILAKAD